MNFRRIPRPLALQFNAAALSLMILAVADTVTPDGWRIFVLAKIFKIAWAASAGFMVGAVVITLLPLSPENADWDRPIKDPPSWLAGSAALAAALITIGYLMPDWNPWSDAIAGVFLTGWAILTFAIRSNQ